MAVRRLALLVVALAALLVPATQAPAASYSTKVVVSLRYPAFHGTLKSKKGSCKANRKVKLFRKRPGRDKLLGADRTDRKARWLIPIGNKLPSGASYYARAAGERNCKPGKSKVLTIG